MLILVILGMYDSIYFDAVVVFVTSQTNLFRLALAILCRIDGQSENLKSKFSCSQFFRKMNENILP